MYFYFKGSLVECVEVPLRKKPSIMWCRSVYHDWLRQSRCCGNDMNNRSTILLYYFVFLFVSFYHSVVRQQWLFLSDTKRVTRLLLPWRPCLDSKLWTKSRSDIKRAFGTQIISRPESCCLNNNVNKKVRQKNANGK